MELQSIRKRAWNAKANFRYFLGMMSVNASVGQVA